MQVVVAVVVKMVELLQEPVVQVDRDQQEGLLVVLLHTMQQMLLITEVVVAVELEIEVVVTQLVVEMVVQELLLLDTNFKINMYLLVFKINI
jgi:hypothetical protein